MKSRSTCVIVVVLAAMISANPAQGGGLKQVGEISIPGEPITDIGIMDIDQTTGLGYLADKTNKSVVVFDTKTDKFVSRIPGFVGRLKDGDASGPNGVVVVKGGAEMWVSDGDSTIKVIDTNTVQITGRIATGGTKRANGMALAEDIGVVIVANSNDNPPFLSFISTAPDRKILARIPIAESGENLERSAYHAASGMFYTAIPVSRADTSKGLLAQTDAKNGKLVKLHELARCHPHSLAVVSESTIFLGCSSAHGPSPKPGGDMAIFDIAAGKVETSLTGYGGNGGSTVNRKLGQYYHSTSGGTLMVVDTKTKQGLQQIPTSNGARSLGVSLANNRVYVATTAKELACRGCIVVYAPE
jgi:DNA-binding beta-propeller fold protein YncE